MYSCIMYLLIACLISLGWHTLLTLCNNLWFDWIFCFILPVLFQKWKRIKINTLKEKKPNLTSDNLFSWIPRIFFPVVCSSFPTFATRRWETSFHLVPISKNDHRPQLKHAHKDACLVKIRGSEFWAISFITGCILTFCYLDWRLGVRIIVTLC